MSRAKLSELKAAIRDGRERGRYALNPYGPPPNWTNAGWSLFEQQMNRAWLRGLSRFRQPLDSRQVRPLESGTCDVAL